MVVEINFNIDMGKAISINLKTQKDVESLSVKTLEEATLNTEMSNDINLIR